jgi:hypothetical protein
VLAHLDNIRRDPRVSIGVDDETLPYAAVIGEGTAAIEECPLAIRPRATRLARRYVGNNLAETYGRRNGVPGEMLVRVTSARVIAHAEVAE